MQRRPSDSIARIRRTEYDGVLVNAVLLALAVVVAWSRFGPYSY